MNLIKRPPTEEDIQALGCDMRFTDRVEMEALGHTDMERIVRESVGMSKDSFAVLDGDKLLCIFGRSEWDGAGVPWMLTTKHAQNIHMVRLLSTCKEVLRGWLGIHGKLWNIVHTDNHRTIKWLRWMGFKVPDKANVQVPSGAAFRLFTMEKADV